MIEEITGYLILALCFFLPCIGLVVLSEKFKKPVHDSLTKRIPLLMKVNRDTVTKGIIAAAVILVLKKLLYYVSFFGVIQTKSSVWWVDEKILTFLIYILALFLILAAAVGFLLTFITISRGQDLVFNVLIILFLVGFLGIAIVLDELKIETLTFDHGLALFLFTPLLFLKMLCSGKYLGLLASFLLGFFIVNRYKKLKPKITGNNAEFLVIPASIFLVFLVYSSYIFPGNWQDRFLNKIHSAKSDAAILELLDAANSINNSNDKFTALKSLAAERNIPWKKETCQRMIEAAMTIKSIKERSSIIKELALTVAKTGDIPRAISVAENISVKRIRDDVLKELREKFEKQ